MRTTLGQNVRNARIPQPTGFGLGSRVHPSLASAMIASKGPVPIRKSSAPAMKNPDRQNRFDS